MAAIKITKSNTSSGDLTMSDHGNTTVDKGEIVTWIVGPKSGVEKIVNIQKYCTSGDIFSVAPHAVGGKSKNWQGTVKSNGNIPDEEIYFIEWIDALTGDSHIYDPKLKMKTPDRRH